jgi:hypothetical protein
MAIGTTAAILGSAAIGAGASLAAGSAQSRAARRSADAIQSSTDQSSATQRYIFDQTRADNRVRQQTGDAASLMMAQLMGLGPRQGQGGQQPQTLPGGMGGMGGPGLTMGGSGPSGGLGGSRPGSMQFGNALQDGEPMSYGGGMVTNQNDITDGNALNMPQFMGRGEDLTGPQYQGEDFKGPQYQGEDVSGPQIYYGGAAVPGGPQVLPGQPGQPGAGGTNALTPTDWLRSTPGYQFNFDEGARAMNTRLAGQGRLQSGDASREAIRYGQNYGDRIYGDQYNRLASIAGAGQVASSANQQAGQNYANQQTNLNMNNANARASSYQSGANAFTNALGGVAGSATWALGQMPSTPPPAVPRTGGYLGGGVF